MAAQTFPYRFNPLGRRGTPLPASPAPALSESGIMAAIETEPGLLGEPSDALLGAPMSAPPPEGGPVPGVTLPQENALDGGGAPSGVAMMMRVLGLNMLSQGSGDLAMSMMMNMAQIQRVQSQMDLERRKLELAESEAAARASAIEALPEDLRPYGATGLEMLKQRQKPVPLAAKVATLEDLLGRKLTDDELLKAGSSGVTVNLEKEYGSPEAQLAVDIAKAEKENPELARRLKNAAQKKTAPTEAQTRAFGFWSRMNRAQDNIDALFEQSPEFDPANLGELGRAPGVAGRLMASPEWRTYMSNAREWISGILRLDSGAAVPQQEFENYFATYFSQVNDPPEVREGKRIRRRAAEGDLYFAHKPFINSRFPQPLNDEDPEYINLAPGQRYVHPETQELVRKVSTDPEDI